MVGGAFKQKGAEKKKKRRGGGGEGFSRGLGHIKYKNTLQL